MKVTKSKVMLFSIAIAFVSVFFFVYVFQAFYPEPSYEDFCNVDVPRQINSDEASCVEAGGKWVNYLDSNLEGWCNYNYFCEQEYQDAKGPHERNIFFASLVVGLILFVVAFFLGLEAVSSGLMGGAVMLIIYGTLRYWGELSDALRALMLGIALVVLIYLGYKRLNY